MKYYIFLAFILVSALGVNAQETSKKRTETIVIQTSAQCGDCKNRIEDALNYTNGIVYADLDLKTKKVTIKYRRGVITPEQIKKKIAEIGYDADEVKAEKAAMEKLPKCCQPGGHK